MKPMLPIAAMLLVATPAYAQSSADAPATAPHKPTLAEKAAALAAAASPGVVAFKSLSALFKKAPSAASADSSSGDTASAPTPK